MRPIGWIFVIVIAVGLALMRLTGGLSLGVLLLMAVTALCLLYISRRKRWL
jgi:predicted ABC-type sugar transport system permease subunit